MGKSVQEIIVERLLTKIKSDNKLPWQKPFAFASINWATEKEYIGINKFLLDGGEYITPNQLKDYNEKHKVNYWFEKGTPFEIVVYYGPTYKSLTDKQQEDIDKNGKNSKLYSKLRRKGNELLIQSWILRYYTVYNIKFIKDKEGNQLPSKLGKIFEERITAPEEIKRIYCESTGVKVEEKAIGEAYYTDKEDKVVLPEMQYFDSSEAYYRVLFHELAHSTGVEHRLNRDCFKKYHQAKSERSREELIAEVSSLLLSTEAGFKEDTTLGNNSDSYILSWVKWMENNTYEVVLGMQQAEKVKNYILNGGTLSNYTDDMKTEAVI